MKIGLIYHTDYKGYEVPHTKKDLHNACKVFDELIVLSADIGNIYKHTLFHRENKIFDMLKPETKVIVGTNSLKERTQYIPILDDYKHDYPKLNFTGTYFNEESFFHKRFRQIWSSLNKIKGRKIWIPYTGAWQNEMYTLPQIMLFKKKFDKVFIQPNYYQKRYGKKVWQMRNLARFIKTQELGVEFEIDRRVAFTKLLHKDMMGYYNRAFSYFEFFKDIKDKAFYTEGLDIGKYPPLYQKRVMELE